MTSVATLQGVYKAYDEGLVRRQVLEGVDLSVGCGEVVVIRGPSGSGKSTILNLLGGLDVCDRGSVRFEGQDIAAASDDQRTLLRRQHIGFVFQFFHLIEGLTVYENLCFPLELLGGLQAAGRARIVSLLEQVGLEDRMDTYPDRLSGGERQRIAVLRAVVHQPRLILADEPTGNLDAANGKALLDLLLEMVSRTGAALVLVTHSDEAAARGDRRFELRAGRLF